LGNVGSLAAKAGTESDALRDAVHGLIGALKDPVPAVRIAAAGALRILAGITPGYPSRGAGKSRAAEAAKPAESQPSVVDKPAVVAALVALLDDQDPEVRQAGLFALAPVAPSVLGDPPRAMFAALEDESATNRAMAIGTLAAFRHGLDPLVQPLLRHLASDEPQVREACSQALGRIRPSALTNAVSAPLIEGLRSHDADVRLRIVSLLAQISPDVHTAVPALIAVLKKEPLDSDQSSSEGSPAVTTFTGPAQRAADALGRIAPGTPESGKAIAALIEVVRSGPPQRRVSAIDALGRFGKEAAVAMPALVAVLGEAESGDEPTGDKASAAAGLGRIAPGTSSADQALAALTTALRSSSPSARRAAIQALPSFGHASASAIPHIRTLKESDPMPSVRKAAASALEELEEGPKAQK
jgi:HEAT repeat protein